MEKGKKGFQPGNTLGRSSRFSSNNQPRAKGRKPALYRELLKATGKRVECELSKEDYYKVIRFLMERTPSELSNLLKDERTPLIVCNIARALLMDTKLGRITTINFVFDRLFGKPTQVIEGELESTINHRVEFDLSILSTEELMEYNILLEKIRINSKQ